MSTNVFPSTGTKPKFDPTQKYEPVEKPIASKKPKFNPNQGYEEVNEVEQKMPAIAVKKKPVQLWDYGFEKTEQPELPKEDYSKPVTEKKVIESVKTVPGVEAQKGESKEKTGQRFGQEIIKAQQHLFNELTSNDDVIERIIRNERGRVEGEAKTDEIMGAPRSDMPSVQNPMLQFDTRIQQDVRAADQPVSPEDIRQEQQKISTDEGRARNVLEYIGQFKPEKKNEIQSSLYKLDVTQRLAEDPNAEKRLPKIMQNAKELAKGNLIYDPRNGQLIKPENIFQSFKTAWKHKEQSYEDFEKFRNIENNEAIAMELDERMKNADPDEPTPIPSGTLGALGGAFGGMPLKVYAAGAVGGLAGPGGAITAASGVGAREAFKLGWANEFQRSYYELRKQGASGFEAVEAARKQADNAANIDAIVGGVTGAIAARIPYRQMTAVNFSGGFRKAVVSALKGYGQVLSPAMKEGILAGGIAAGGESYKNELAKEAGINRDASENVLEVAEMNLLMPLAIGAISGAAKLSKPAYRHIMQGLHNIPEGVFNNALSEFVSRGNITEEQAASVKNQVQEYGKVDATLPENIAPEAKVEIRGLIERRNELETQLEKTDKAFHPEIKEKIKAIEEQITEKSKDRVKPDKEKAEIKSLIDEGISEGLPGFGGIMKDIAQNDPTGFMKFVADQALGRTETGAMSELGNAEYAAREAFGDGVVERAVKMFPLEPQKPKVTVSTPIIRNVRAKEGAIPEFDIQYQQGKPTGTLLQGKDLIAEGSESTVYRDGDTVIKVSEPYNDASTFNARVEDARIISEQLGDNSVELIGTYKSQNGTPNPIFRQKFIEGEKATPEQIDAYMESKGFQKKDGGWENDQYRFTDIDSDNAIVDANGQVHIIDAGVKKLKSTQDAVQVESAEGIPVREPSVNRGEMGEGVPKPEELAGESAQSESQVTGQEGEMIGITHEQMNQTARELGLPEYQGDPETVAGWDFEANKRIQNNPNAIPELLNKLRDGKMPDAVEQRMMLKYMSDLKARINKDPMNDGLLDAWKQARNLSDIVGGREVGKSLRARQGTVPVEETLADYMIRQQEASQVGKLTEKQKETNIREFEEFQKAKNNWDAYNAKRIDELATQKAEAKLKELKAEGAKAPKQKRDYTQERKEIFQSIQDKLKKARGEASATVVPYAKELFAIAPDVAKLVKNLVEQGIDKLPDLIKAVHDELKDVIKEIKPEDVRALIAGEYNEKGRTRSELAAKIKDLRDQASLIGRLQELEAGAEPKSERAKVKRNKEIEELKQKIKEHDLTKLAAAKSRMKAEIAKLEKDIADGKYAPEEKTEIKLDKEGQALKDKLIELRRLREIRLAEEEYAQRSTREKIWSYISAPFREVRTLKSSFDLSAPLRQGVVPTAAEIVTNPARAGKRFANMLRSAGSEKYFNRWIADLKESPQWKIMEESGLSISEPGHITKKEEVFQSQLAQRIPIIGTHGIKGSERAYSYWLNAQRVDLFKQGAEILQDKGMTFENSKEAYKSWASTVNALTGRGELAGPLKNAAEALSIGFFSPRLIASRLSFFNPMFYKNIPAPLRKIVVGNMLKFVGLGTSILMLSKLAGADVEEDPRSPDFGKIRTGDTRYDIWGGFQQYIRLFSQLATQSKKTSSGRIESLMSDKEGDTKNKSGSVIGTFLRSKAAPLLGSLINVATGEDVVGQPVTVTSEAKRFLLPILWEDVYKAAKENGVKGALATAIPGMLGVGVQSYPAPAPKKSESNKRKRAPRNKRKNPRTQNN